VPRREHNTLISEGMETCGVFCGGRTVLIRSGEWVERGHTIKLIRLKHSVYFISYVFSRVLFTNFHLGFAASQPKQDFLFSPSFCTARFDTENLFASTLFLPIPCWTPA
jgi:hypothetical protein